MPDEDRRAIALSFLDAHALADQAGMSSLLSAEARFHTLKSAVEWAGMPPIITGNDKIAGMLASRHGANGETAVWKAGETSWEHHFTVAEDDHVVVYTTRRSVTIAGAKYESPYVVIFGFAGSEIVDLWEVLDTAYAQKVAQLPPVTSSAWRGE